MAGRPKKPKRLHLLHGTARADRPREGELELSGPIGDPPDYLTGEALAEWQHVTGDKNYNPVLSPVFRSVLADYCLLHGEMVAEARGGEPMTMTSRIYLGSLRVQLGLTPAAQSKVAAPKVEKPKSKWDDVGYRR